MSSIDENPKELGFELSVIELPRQFEKGNLIQEFMRFRKKVFVDRMAWPLYHMDDVEFEQYDTIDTTYVIAHSGDQVLGGARLKRTDATLGTGRIVYSYMIRDAHLGILPGMPATLCSSSPPIDPNVWELTRLVAVSDPPGVAEAILRESNKHLFAKGATSCLFLGSPAFMRMARRLGWSPQPMGPIVGNDDGRFLAFKCGVLNPCLEAAAAG